MFKNIWDSHSALSEESDIYTLTFVRWNRREEFSPWNCILLTLQEATAHLKIENIEAVRPLNYVDSNQIHFYLFCSVIEL
jgi:metal-dependent HD superfamily phosphatase/phosphodiesterase